MSTNYEVFLHMWEQDPDGFFTAWFPSSEDGTLTEEDNEMLLKKMEHIQSVNYREICVTLSESGQLNLDPSKIRHKIFCHYLIFLFKKHGNWDSALKALKKS